MAHKLVKLVYLSDCGGPVHHTGMKKENTTMKKMFSLAAGLALLALLAAGPVGATSTTQPGVKVAATATNTATDFAADVRSVCIYNAGANEVFYSFNAAATAGVNEIPAGTTVCFSEIEIVKTTATATNSAIVGIICSAAETSTVYLYAVAR